MQNESNRILILTLASLFIAGCGFSMDCTKTADRSTAISADGATAVRIIARAGSLRVSGADGTMEVGAKGIACASSDSLLDKVRLTSRRSGTDIVIEAEIPTSSGWRSSTARLDFTVEVPSNLPISIEDGSGSTEVEHVASLKLHDGSGEIVVRDVAAAVEIDDGSGSIRIEDVRGDVKVDDGSGSIDIRQVAGSVRIDDGSGSIEVREVGKDVVIEDDGSGGIDVNGVGGDFIVRNDGSGSIDFSGVKGQVKLPRKR